MPGGWIQEGFSVDMEVQSQAAQDFHPAPDRHTCSWTGTVWRQPEAQLAGVKVTAALKGKGTSDDMYSQDSLLELSKSSSCSEVAAAGFFDPSPRLINSLPPSSGLMPRTFMYVLRGKTFPPGFLPGFFMLTQELDLILLDQCHRQEIGKCCCLDLLG